MSDYGYSEGYSSEYNFGLSDKTKKRIIITVVAIVLFIALLLGILFGSGALKAGGDDGGDLRGNLIDKCELLEIERLRPPQSGQVIFEKGEKFQLDCIRGFSMFTNDLVRTCGDNGQFLPSLENSKAECKPDCKAPDYKNYRRPNGVFKFKHGYRLNPECLGGFSLETTVFERTCIDGKFEPSFSQVPIFCTQDCKSPPFDNFLPPDDAFLEGYILELKCEEGYTLETDEVYRTCQDTKFVPGFTPGDPNSVSARCLQDCPPPDFSNYEGPDGGTKHNVAVQLKCKTGYGLETDDQDRVCNYGNFIPSFDTAPASCLQICAKPTFANFLDVNEDKKQDVFVKGIVSKEYVEDFDLTLGCETKFSLLTEAVTRKCQGGKFTPSFDVKPAECNPDCSQPKNYIRGYKLIEEKLNHGYELNLKCSKPSYIRTKVNKRICEKGNWVPGILDIPAICTSSEPTCTTVSTACECEPSTGEGNIKLNGVEQKKDTPTFSINQGSFNYLFNPCQGFSISGSSEKYQSIVRKTRTGEFAGTEKDLGSQRKSTFAWNSEKEKFQVIYISEDEKASSEVVLTCDTEVDTHTFRIIGQKKRPPFVPGPDDIWVFELEGPCMCPGRC